MPSKNTALWLLMVAMKSGGPNEQENDIWVALIWTTNPEWQVRYRIETRLFQSSGIENSTTQYLFVFMTSSNTTDLTPTE